ncbi:MAG: ABC transporter ATP-binding protein, partial [Halodesulfurarchaeum sp.]
VTFEVYEGEIVTLLGPSGCGKTTTLRLLAGLEEPSAGRIRIRDDLVADSDQSTAPEERSIGMVFQEFALFPHLSVRENIAFGLDGLSEEETEERVDSLLDLVDLDGFGDRSPDHLSGGQRQRVALARSLAPEPDILLLDEPFSSLDIRLRVEMREEVRRILKAADVTTVSVTHDQEEALSISDRIAVMHEGTVEQTGPPGTVFQRPTSRFVAEFLGDAGFVSATVDGAVETPIGSLDRDRLRGLQSAYDDVPVDVLVRPDDVKVRPNQSGDADGTIVRRQYTGPSFIYHVELDNGDEVRCLHDHDDDYPIGTRVDVSLVADHSLAWFPKPGALETPD